MLHFSLYSHPVSLFENVGRFSDPNYEPSTQDVLRARSRTTGIDEAEFHFNDIDFRLIDVGGQRSERRKWIRCFDCVTAVIFCISMSEYDQYLREDPSQVRCFNVTPVMALPLTIFLEPHSGVAAPL